MMSFKLRLTFALLAVTMIQSLAAQDMKIAVVDIDRVIATSKMGQALNAELQEMRKKAQDQVQVLADQAKAIEAQGTQNAATLSEAKRAELRREFEDTQIQARRVADDAQAQIQAKRQEGFQKIQEALRPIFEALRDKDGYDLIIDRNTVLIMSVKADITALVLERFDAASGS